MANKAHEKERAQENAARLAYLRSGKFVLEGYNYNDDPSVANARAMAARNLAKLVGDGRVGGFKTPCIGG